jgi:hypothetical protein
MQKKKLARALSLVDVWQEQTVEIPILLNGSVGKPLKAGYLCTKAGTA